MFTEITTYKTALALYSHENLLLRKLWDPPKKEILSFPKKERLRIDGCGGDGAVEETSTADERGAAMPGEEGLSAAGNAELSGPR